MDGGWACKCSGRNILGHRMGRHYTNHASCKDKFKDYIGCIKVFDTSLARGLKTFISARSTSPAVNEEANDGSRYDFIYMSMRLILLYIRISPYPILT